MHGHSINEAMQPTSYFVHFLHGRCTPIFVQKSTQSKPRLIAALCKPLKTMTKYADILVIKGDWDGGNHGSYPKILSVNPGLDRPFSITEGWGHGLGGGTFTLKELVEQKFLEIFNRIESQAIYHRLVSEHRLKKDGKKLAAELLARYGENA